MPLLPKLASRFATRKVAPVLLLADYARATKVHWDEHLTSRERQRLLELLRKSGGRPSQLTKRQRDELFALVRQLEPVGLAKRLALTTTGLGDTTHKRRPSK